MRSNVYNFRVMIEPDGIKNYHGFVPRLKGVHSHGGTVEETKKNLKEAIVCHLQGLLKDKENIPQEENTLEAIQSVTEKELAVK